MGATTWLAPFPNPVSLSLPHHFPVLHSFMSSCSKNDQNKTQIFKVQIDEEEGEQQFGCLLNVFPLKPIREQQELPLTG